MSDLRTKINKMKFVEEEKKKFVCSTFFFSLKTISIIPHFLHIFVSYFFPFCFTLKYYYILKEIKEEKKEAQTINVHF